MVTDRNSVLGSFYMGFIPTPIASDSFVVKRFRSCLGFWKIRLVDATRWMICIRRRFGGLYLLS